MIPYESGHISDALFTELNQNVLDDETSIKIFEHIASCSYCAERYASSLETDLIQVPTELKASVIDQAIRIPTALQTARVRFYRYCFRVGLAVCAALFLVITSSSLESRDYVTPRTPTATESRSFLFMDQLSNRLLNFSEQLVPNFNREDPKHD